MPQPLDLNRLLEAGRQLTENGRSQARELGTDLVTQGRVASEYVSAVVDELVGRPGRDRMEELRQTVRAELEQQLRDQLQANAAMVRDAVRDEVQRQLRELGLATQADLARLETTVRESLAALERTIAAAVASASSDPGHGGYSSATD
jgi:polyhydroxyalkanoate synthesis regulator phasin